MHTQMWWNISEKLSGFLVPIPGDQWFPAQLWSTLLNQFRHLRGKLYIWNCMNNNRIWLICLELNTLLYLICNMNNIWRKLCHIYRNRFVFPFLECLDFELAARLKLSTGVLKLLSRSHNETKASWKRFWFVNFQVIRTNYRWASWKRPTFRILDMRYLVCDLDLDGPKL